MVCLHLCHLFEQSGHVFCVRVKSEHFEVIIFQVMPFKNVILEIAGAYFLCIFYVPWGGGGNTFNM